MTTEQKYQFVREAIITACPELLELSFGCIVKIKLYKNEEYHEGTYWFGGKSDCPLIPEGSKYFKYFISKEDGEFSEDEVIEVDDSNIQDIKIIGHPIRISHILRALEKKRKPYLVDASGIFYAVSDSLFLSKNVGNAYVMEYDSLEWHKDNKPELIDFLYNIFKENK